MCSMDGEVLRFITSYDELGTDLVYIYMSHSALFSVLRDTEGAASPGWTNYQPRTCTSWKFLCVWRKMMPQMTLQ